MTDRELKHMGRQGLIELLCQLKKENNALKERNWVLQEKLEEKSVKIADAGTLAEAMVSVNGVMEAAQKAADRYLEEIARKYSETEKECDEMKERTNQACRKHEEESQLHINAKWKEFSEKVERYCQTHSELETLMNTEEQTR